MYLRIYDTIDTVFFIAENSKDDKVYIWDAEAFLRLIKTISTDGIALRY